MLHTKGGFERDSQHKAERRLVRELRSFPGEGGKQGHGRQQDSRVQTPTPDSLLPPQMIYSTFPPTLSAAIVHSPFSSSALMTDFSSFCLTVASCLGFDSHFIPPFLFFHWFLLSIVIALYSISYSLINT